MSVGLGWIIIDAAASSKAPALINSTLPPPPSSAGVPSTVTLMPRSSTRGTRARPAPMAAVAMMLCPHAWPTSGRASYSQQITTRGPEVPMFASKAVSNP